ncbi:hypothetical protein [Chitinibacter sp. GC72]|uniref:hypothetical protein n=1 Tax=Chitinibacter sp. GC72 TaxID=1526917 RepID=UPI0012FBE8B7|nr:hypothetical protein [Chitinibacter sp. GC72]
MSIQFNGVNLYTIAQACEFDPPLHARILNLGGDWLVLFGKKLAFTDDADLVGILYETGQTAPVAFSSKTAAADFLDQHAQRFASVSC